MAAEGQSESVDAFMGGLSDAREKKSFLPPEFAGRYGKALTDYVNFVQYLDGTFYETVCQSCQSSSPSDEAEAKRTIALIKLLRKRFLARADEGIERIQEEAYQRAMSSAKRQFLGGSVLHHSCSKTTQFQPIPRPK